MIAEIQQRIAEGYCYFCTTDNFQHKELCSKNPTRPKALSADQINPGGIYRFRTLPRSIFAPSEGVVRVTGYQWTNGRGIVFMLQLQREDGSWLYPDKPYACVSLYDVEFFHQPERSET